MSSEAVSLEHFTLQSMYESFSCSEFFAFDPVAQLSTSMFIAVKGDVKFYLNGLVPATRQGAGLTEVVGDRRFPLVGGPAGTMEGGRQADVAKAILSSKNVPYVVAAPLLIQVRFFFWPLLPSRGFTMLRTVVFVCSHLILTILFYSSRFNKIVPLILTRICGSR
jgi:hypothetical protein